MGPEGPCPVRGCPPRRPVARGGGERWARHRPDPPSPALLHAALPCCLWSPGCSLCGSFVYTGNSCLSCQPWAPESCLRGPLLRISSRHTCVCVTLLALISLISELYTKKTKVCVEISCRHLEVTVFLYNQVLFQGHLFP